MWRMPGFFSVREGSLVMASRPNEGHISAEKAGIIAKRIADGARALGEGTDSSLALGKGNKTLKYLGDLCALTARSKNPLGVMIDATGVKPVSLSAETRRNAKMARDGGMKPYRDYGSITGVLSVVSNMGEEPEVTIQGELPRENLKCKLNDEWMKWALEHFGQRVEACGWADHTPQGKRTQMDVIKMKVPPEPLPWSDVPKLAGILKVF